MIFVKVGLGVAFGFTAAVALGLVVFTHAMAKNHGARDDSTFEERANAWKIYNGFPPIGS